LTGFLQLRSPKYSNSDTVSANADWENTLAYGRISLNEFVVLECLTSISIIGMNTHGYYIKTRLSIDQLGRYIQPGILGVLKSTLGLGVCTELTSRDNALLHYFL
jgi:hypothetical protein